MFLGFFYQLIAVPAVIVLGFWFLLQVADGIGSLGATTVVDGGVAVFAHIGGFRCGALLALPSDPAAAPPAAAAGPAPRRWDNRRMDETRGIEIEMVVESVRVHMPTGRHVLLLKEIGLGRILPIWIGPWEASAIAARLQGVAPERPLTHDLLRRGAGRARRAPGPGR